MENALVTYETAKLLKEKGFKESVLYHYWRIDGDNSDFEKNPRPNSELIREVDAVMSSDNDTNGCEVSVNMLNRNYLWEDSHPILGECKSFIAVPTQSLAQKWLREVHNIHIELQFDTISYGYRIFNPFKSEDYFTDWRYKTWKYEECLEEALQEALKLI